MRPVAGVDDRAVDLAGEQMHRARLTVPHDENVGPHGVQGHRGVDERLALLHAGGADRHVHDVRAEPLSGKLEGGLGAGRGLEEQVDLRSAPQASSASSRPAAKWRPPRPRDRAAPRFRGDSGARSRADGAGRRQASWAGVPARCPTDGASFRALQASQDRAPHRNISEDNPRTAARPAPRPRTASGRSGTSSRRSSRKSEARSALQPRGPAPRIP